MDCAGPSGAAAAALSARVGGGGAAPSLPASSWPPGPARRRARTGLTCRYEQRPGCTPDTKHEQQRL